MILNQDNQLALPTMGFIGLGNIGRPMALKLHETLLERGAVLTVYDHAAEAMTPLMELGAVCCASLAGFSGCGVVGVCVRDDDDVDSLLEGEGDQRGLLSVLAAGAVIAIHSTVTRDNILRWRDLAAEHDIVLVDAPITGGAEGAQNGRLCYIVGGEQEDYQLVARCYGAAAKEVLHAGPVGSAVVLKLANNLMSYSAFAAASEALALIEDSGISLEKMLRIGEINGVVTPQMQRFISNRELLAAGCNDDEMLALMGPFAELAEKDLAHALTLAEQSTLTMAVAELVRNNIRSVFLKK